MAAEVPFEVSELTFEISELLFEVLLNKRSRLLSVSLDFSRLLFSTHNSTPYLTAPIIAVRVIWTMSGSLGAWTLGNSMEPSANVPIQVPSARTLTFEVLGPIGSWKPKGGLDC